MEKGSSFFKMAPITWASFLKELHMEKEDIAITTDAYIKEKLKIIKLMELEYIMIHSKAINTMENGRMISPTVKENKNSKTDRIMKDSSFMESNQGSDIMYATQEFMKESFRMVISMVMVYLLMLITDSTMDNGRTD